jgi:hypothetical protein
MTPHPKAAGYPYDPFAPDALRGTQLYLRSQLAVQLDKVEGVSKHAAVSTVVPDEVSPRRRANCHTARRSQHHFAYPKNG